jgi:hypothetical protein
MLASDATSENWKNIAGSKGKRQININKMQEAESYQ